MTDIFFKFEGKRTEEEQEKCPEYSPEGTQRKDLNLDAGFGDEILKYL